MEFHNVKIIGKTKFRVFIVAMIKNNLTFLLFITDITVNGLVVGKIPMTDKIQRMRTYFGKLAILSPFLNITVNPNKVKFIGKKSNGNTLNKVTYWNKTETITSNFSVNITGNKYLTVSLAEGITLSVLRHKVRKHHPFKVDYLGLYITDGTGLSLQTKGLIGKVYFSKEEFIRSIYLLYLFS